MTFNRTSMELKPIETVLSEHADSAFNRTSMELKHAEKSEYEEKIKLLIEPVWN